MPPGRQQMVQPFFHGLLQVVIRPAEPGVAAGDEIILLALQGAAGARIVGGGFADHSGVRRVDLAVEIGQIPDWRRSPFPPRVWRSRN